MRREFSLAGGRPRLLATTNLDWEAIVEGNTKWLILRRFPIRPATTSRSPTRRYESPVLPR